MGEFLNKLRVELNRICPTFTQMPLQTPYPYITLEADNVLQGLPWGPSMVMLNVKIWSRYAGIKEIIKLTKEVEEVLYGVSIEASLKIIESSLILLKDGQTRVHTFRLKTRVLGGK